jgi:hypothetical protein
VTATVPESVVAFLEWVTVVVQYACLDVAGDFDDVNENGKPPYPLALRQKLQHPDADAAARCEIVLTMVMLLWFDSVYHSLIW